MLAEAVARWIAESWVAAWNARDLDQIVAHYADDVTLTSPLVVERCGLPDGTVRGKAQLRDYFGRGLAAVPNLRFELRDILIGVDGLAIVYDRENGRRVVEVVATDERGLVTNARVYYSQTDGQPF